VKVWIDGAIVDGSAARVPVTDHGLLYGDGIFEGIRIYGRAVFRLDAHLRRFETAARAIGLAPPSSVADVRQIVLDTARALDEDEAYLRLLFTRGDGPLGIDPTKCPQPRLICIADRIRVYSAEERRRGIALLTSSVRRPPADVLDPRVKSLNYLNNVLAKLEARQRGGDEALLLNASGGVAEASVANVFVVRDGVLATPAPTDGALEGITRASVLELAASLAIPASEKALGRFDLFAADEVFLSGTGAGLVPVRSLDERPIGAGGPGPVYERIRKAFLEAAPALGTPL
jgi:branched-chain amino acid aminotransferase